MRKSEIIILTTILLSFALGVYFYPQMPEVMASHWNIRGQVDGYMSKFWGVFLMPLIALFTYLVFVLVPKIDPLKENVKKFRIYFDRFIILIIFFLFYVYLLSLSWNIGLRFDMGRLMMPALGILLYYSGVLIKNSKRNWFIGIKNPWTLSNDIVWTKTHNLGGNLFKLIGVFAFFGVLIPEYAFFIVIFPLIAVVFITYIYSFIQYKKQFKKV